MFILFENLMMRSCIDNISLLHPIISRELKECILRLFHFPIFCASSILVLQVAFVLFENIKNKVETFQPYFFFLKIPVIFCNRVGNLTTLSLPICSRAIFRILPESLEAKRNFPLSVQISKWRLTFLPETLAPIVVMLVQGS